MLINSNNLKLKNMEQSKKMHQYLLDKILSNCEKELKQYAASDTKPNDKYSFDYSIKSGYLFVLAYCTDNTKECFNTAYLKACYNLDDFGTLLYKDMNVTDSEIYIIQDVERATKVYFNIIASNFNELIK